MKYLVYYEHKLHDNESNSPVVIYASSEKEAVYLFERDNQQFYVTFVEEDCE